MDIDFQAIAKLFEGFPRRRLRSSSDSVKNTMLERYGATVNNRVIVQMAEVIELYSQRQIRIPVAAGEGKNWIYEEQDVDVMPDDPEDHVGALIGGPVMYFGELEYHRLLPDAKGHWKLMGLVPLGKTLVVAEDGSLYASCSDFINAAWIERMGVGLQDSVERILQNRELGEMDPATYRWPLQPLD